MSRWMAAAIVLCTALFSLPPLHAQPAETKLNADPGAAQIISSDIDNFWKAFDAATPENNLYVFRDQYIRKGSKGLREFTELRIGSSCELVDAIEAHPKFYRSIRESTLKAHTFKEPIRAAFRKLESLYEPALFPDVYLLIGRMTSGGTYTQNALLIGTEMYGRTKDMPIEELKDWHRQVLKPVDEIPHIVAHELIHYQQKYPQPNKSLLGASISEGSADFLAELISGKHINQHLHEYGDAHEEALWLEFKQDKPDDTSAWLYNGGTSKDRPADLGYYIGYKIAQAYYERAADKKQAVKDILEIQDFERFVQQSGYEEKLAGFTHEEARAIHAAVAEYLRTQKPKLHESAPPLEEPHLDFFSNFRMGGWLLERDRSEARLTWRIAETQVNMVRQEIRIVREGDKWKAVSAGEVIYHLRR